MKDSIIIDLFFERSEQAILELANKYGGIFRKICFNILNNIRDAEECVNDTYLETWNTIPPQKPSPLLAYVCRIARNISIKKYHFNMAVKRNSYYDIALSELEDCIPSPNMVEDTYSAKELANIIDNFLETLDTDNRVMFIKRYWFSESLAEISKTFHLKEHTVSVRLYRIRNKMKRYLESRGIRI